MRLYLIRHGKAEADSDTGRDEDRPLKQRGVRQATRLGKHLGSNGHKPKLILSSGLVRAEQTADILAESLNAERVIEPVLGLGHRASDVVEILEQLQRQRQADALIIVGHNPQLEHLVAVLTEGPTAKPVRMRTGQCAVLDVPNSGTPLLGSGKLVEMLRFDDD